jgi:hypothetical protein
LVESSFKAVEVGGEHSIKVAVHEVLEDAIDLEGRCGEFEDVLA